MTDKTEAFPEFKPGSWEVLRYLRDNCDWPAGAKMVYKALYERWGNGPLYPKDATIAKDLGVTDRFVRKWRSWLANRGFITWISGKEVAEPNMYTLMPPWAPESKTGKSEPRSYYSRNDVPTTQGKSERDSDLVGTTFRPSRNDVPTKYPNEVPTEDKGTGTTAAIKKTDVLGKNLSSEEELRGGCGGRNWPGIPKEWVTVVPPIPEWNGVLECKRALNQVLIILGNAELTRDEPFAQQDEAGRPYALVLQKFKDAAATRGRPLQWWIQHAGILAARLERHFDAAFLEASLEKLARGEVLNPGVPEWASLNDFLFSKDPKELWADEFEPGEAARLGDRLPRTAAAVFSFMRWAAVNEVALGVGAEGNPSAPQLADQARDLLLEAEESGARLEDDAEAMQFRLVGGQASVRAELTRHGELVDQILQTAYRLPERPIYHDYVMWLHSRLWRMDLVEALERGNWSQVEQLVQEDPEYAAALSQARGWAERYPGVASLLRTLESIYAS